ncbi:phage holin family protein [Lysinibacillus irui]|uniref:phage holin family protein n=1 Tax=Lysinibacillus irui TaxID=2998077 RepID=UPI0040443BE4
MACRWLGLINDSTFNFECNQAGLLTGERSVVSEVIKESLKKMMWVWIAVANLIYLVLQDQGFSIGQIIPDAVVLMYILNELVSLGENSAKLGVDMPVPVKKALEVFNSREEKAK